jgi:hypothetical protein
MSASPVTRRAPQIASDFLELITTLQESLDEAWREIQALRERVTALSPAPEPLTVEQIAERHPALKVGGIRWMLFHRHTNGLAQSGAVIERGRRLYLDEARFLEWFTSQKQKSAAFKRRRGGA